MAFQSWLDRTVLHREQRGSAVPRILSRLKVSNLSSALKKWARAAASMAEVERNSRQVLGTMRRTLKQMTEVRLARGWRVWKDLHGKQQRHDRCRRVVKRLLRRRWVGLCGRAFLTWHAGSLAHAAKQKTVKRTLRRMQRRDQSAAIASWRTFVHFDRQRQHKEERQHGVCRRAALMLRKSATAVAWRQWGLVVREAKKEEDYATLVTKRLSRLGLTLSKTEQGRGFRTWRIWLEQHRGNRRLLSRTMQTAAKVRAHLLQRDVSRGFTTWKAHAENKRALTERLRRGNKDLARLLLDANSRQSRRAWRQWRLVCDDRARIEAVVARMRSRQRTAGTKGGFVQWLRFCAAKRAEEERFKQMSKRARSALLKMLKNATLGALIRWKAVVATRNAILASAKKLCRFAVEAYEDNVKFATRRALRAWHTALQRLDKRSMLSGHKLALVIKSLQSKSYARLAVAWRRLERQVRSEREASLRRRHRGSCPAQTMRTS